MPKRKRKSPKFQGTKRQKTVSVVPVSALFPARADQQQVFVPRSFGNPRAVTERKYYTVLRASTALPAISTDWASTEFDPATVNTLFAPTQGDDYLNRQGRKVQVLAIKIKGTMACAAQADQIAGDSASQIRIVLVQDRQTNATQLNGEDVFQGQASASINTFQNPAFFGRFRILKDKMMMIQNPNFTYDGTNIEQHGLARTFKMTVKFKKPVVVHFNATNGGTVADIVDNSFHILAAAGNINLAPQITYVCRTTFIDL